MFKTSSNNNIRKCKNNSSKNKCNNNNKIMPLIIMCIISNTKIKMKNMNIKINNIHMDQIMRMKKNIVINLINTNNNYKNNNNNKYSNKDNNYQNKISKNIKKPFLQLPKFLEHLQLRSNKKNNNKKN